MPSDLQTPSSRSWIARLTQAITGEPKDKDELMEMLNEACSRELLDINSLRMIEGVLDVSELRVQAIMIPRSHMTTIDNEMSFEEIMKTVVESGHSRYPVIGENKDEIVGILIAKDLLAYYTPESKQRFLLRDILRPAVFIPESKRLDVLLQEFKEQRYHMAIVVDEYGGVNGLVTIEDVLEQIVGDIADEYDIDEGPGIREYKNNRYIIRGLTTLEDFNEYFDIELEDDEVETIGGLVTRKLGHVPKRGESIEIAGIVFTVMRADTRRVHTLQAMIKDNNEEN